MAERHTLTVRVPRPLYDRLRRLAWEQHTSLNALAVAALAAWAVHDRPPADAEAPIAPSSP